jgi:hypothetical protein
MEILKKNVFEVTSRLVRDQREYINNSEREREREREREGGVECLGISLLFVKYFFKLILCSFCFGVCLYKACILESI